MIEALIMMEAATVPSVGDPPSGPPTDPSGESYSSPAKIRALWTNGDSTAYTEVWYNLATNNFATATLEGTVVPGVVFLDTSLSFSGTTFMWVRHKKNGQFSTEVGFTVTTGEA